MPDRRTYADRREYVIRAVSKHRRVNRQKLVTYKGGKCSICGYNKCIGALDLHHIDDSKKEFTISDHGLTLGCDKIVAEADKCVLLCANCHREVHAGIIELQPLTVTSE